MLLLLLLLVVVVVAAAAAVPEEMVQAAALEPAMRVAVDCFGGFSFRCLRPASYKKRAMDRAASSSVQLQYYEYGHRYGYVDEV
jgi:hypothetical protein